MGFTGRTVSSLFTTVARSVSDHHAALEMGRVGAGEYYYTELQQAKVTYKYAFAQRLSLPFGSPNKPRQCDWLAQNASTSRSHFLLSTLSLSSTRPRKPF